jgi:hypothetical protein
LAPKGASHFKNENIMRDTGANKKEYCNANVNANPNTDVNVITISNINAIANDYVFSIEQTNLVK